MILDLREFQEFPVHKDLRCDDGSFALTFDSVKKVKTVEVHLSIQQSDEEYYCQGGVKASLTVECARCLGSYEAEVDGELDFIMCSEAKHEEFVQEATDSEDYVLFEGQGLVGNISDVVRQAIILGLGLKPICSDDCLGLCSVCGKNRNESDCDCSQSSTDPRWAALADLKDSLSSDKKE